MTHASPEDDPSADLSHRRRLAGVVGLWIFVGLIWSLAIPPLEAPDEMAHADMVRHVVDGRSYPRDPITIDAATVASRVWILDQLDDGRFTVAVIPRTDRPTLAALDSDTTFDAPNQMVQHPPLGYAPLVLTEAAIRGLAPGLAFDLHLWLLRVASVVLSATIPLFIARGVRMLGGSCAQQLVAALVPLAIPQLSASMGTIGNDLPLVVIAAAAALATATVLVHPSASGVRLGVAVGLGALTKGFGLALVVLPLAPVLSRSRRWRPALAAGAVALAIAGWWWLWNVARFGTIQPHGVPLEDLYGPARPGGPGIGSWVREAAPLLVDRFWGAFGSFRRGIGIPRGIALVASAVATAAVVRGYRRGPTATRQFARVHLLLAGAALAILARGSFTIFHDHRVLLGVQGRYLFVAVPGLAVVAGLACSHRTTPRRAATATAVIVAVMQVTALGNVLVGWWGSSTAPLGDRLHAVTGWSPVTPRLLAPLLLVLLVSAGWALLGPSRAPAARPAPAP